MQIAELSIGLQIYTMVLSFVLGTVFGSFCNAWAWRIVNHERITNGRSHCTVCGHVLNALDLIPVFSYLFLRGKCRYCGSKISPRYLIAELLSGLYYLSILTTYGLTLTTLRLLALGSVLLTLSLVDIDTMEIPNQLIAVAGALAFLRLAEGTTILTLLTGCIPAVMLFVFVLIMDRILKKETMGGGDIKLLLVLGLHYDALGAVLILIFACIIGIIAAKVLRIGKSTPFPFGPSLVLASWIVAIVGDKIITAYLSTITRVF